MAPIRNLKSPSVPETSSETCLFTFSFGLNRRTPAGTADRGKIVKNLASLTHTCTHGDGEMHIFHTTVNGIPFRIHTCNASICSHKPGQNSISNRKKKRHQLCFSLEFSERPQTDQFYTCECFIQVFIALNSITSMTFQSNNIFSLLFEQKENNVIFRSFFSVKKIIETPFV